MKPNFFIIGAPKCGTTALCEYLKEHPHIFISDPKEPHYFAEDFDNYRLVKTKNDYFDLFKDAQEDNVAVGEGSVFYLYSSVALQNIYQFDSQAKIIVMLRKPSELVYSFHSQLLYSADEQEQDFETAWYLQSLRKQGKKIPTTCREAELLQYAAVGKLGKQIERLFTIFPRQQVEIIWFEDFISNTQQVYDRVLDFLAVPHDNRTDFSRINENKKHKLSVLGRFSEKPPVAFTEILMQTKKILGIDRLGLLDTIRSFNTKTGSRSPLKESFHIEIAKEFKDDVNKLAKILDKDLSNWTVD